MEPGIFLGLLFQSRDIAHIAHLQTYSYAQHKTLNTFYDEVLELVDELTESFFGINGRVDLTIPSSSLVNAESYLQELRKMIYSNRSCLGMENTELQNIVDEIVGLIDQTLYQLTLS